MANFRVALPYAYVPDPTRGRPIYNGSLYIGEPDEDPEVYPIQAYLLQTGGTLVAVNQPITLGAGGVPMYNGSPAVMVVQQNYSIRVRNSAGTQVYYADNALDAGLLESAYIPIAGTSAGAPITGQLVFDKQSNNGWTMDQGSLFGQNAFILTGQVTDSAAYIVTKDSLGNTQQFEFNPDGEFRIPTVESAVNVSWLLKSRNFLGDPNAFALMAWDNDTQTQASGILQFYSSASQFMQFDKNGKLYLSGVISGADADQIAATKKYVDDQILGAGSLPATPGDGDVLIGSGGAWTVASHLNFDEDTTPGQADITHLGRYTLTNLDTGSYSARLRQGNFLTVNMTILEFFGDAGGLMVCNTTLGAGNEVQIAAGFITLPQDPTSAMHAATKQYVDNNGLPAAPADNSTLRATGGAWVESSAVQILSGGNLSLSQPMRAPNGTAAAPSYSFTGHTGDGVYSDTAGALQFSAGGVKRLEMSAFGLSSFLQILAQGGSASAPGISIYGDPNTGMYSDAADALRFSTAGVKRLEMSAFGCSSFVQFLAPSGGSAAPGFAFYDDPDTGILLGLTNELRIATGGINRLWIDNSYATFHVPIRSNSDSETGPGFTWYGNASTGMFHPATDVIGFSCAGDQKLQILNYGIRVDEPSASPSASVSIISRGTMAIENWPTSTGTDVVANFGVLSYKSSDIRLKENIVEPYVGLDQVLATEIIEFDWKENGVHDIGFHAQQLIKVIPEAVDYNEEKDQYGMRSMPLIAALFQAVKQIDARLVAKRI